MVDVVFFCPDRHILYNGTLPAETGVGGGITARIRMAQALARQGQSVTMVVNCPREEVVGGVRFIPLDSRGKIDTSTLLVNSSGGAYRIEESDLEPFRAEIRLYWMSGVDPPAGFHADLFNYVYAKSNFLRKRAVEFWGVPPEKVFVSYNGFENSFFVEAEHRGLPRDPHRMIYFSHPSKGLNTALRVLSLLRERDSRFHLKVFGGNALWGQEQKSLKAQPGLKFGGLIGQRDLAAELMQASFSLCLQDREEPFGMVLTESQRAGCVVVASPAGAFAELIENGVDGFLIEGPASADHVITQAAGLIDTLSKEHTRWNKISSHASEVPWSSDFMARVWLQHWEFIRSREGEVAEDRSCAECGAVPMIFPDGYHCVQCGWFRRIFW